MPATDPRTVVLALNYQNEVLHPEGRTRLGVAPDGLGRASAVEAVTRLLTRARHGLPRHFSPRRLIIAGVATKSSVEATVRYAFDIGYDVHVAADACICGDPVLHAASLRNMALIAEGSDMEHLLG